MQVDHRRLAVRVSVRPECTAHRLGADPLHVRLTDHAPVVVDVVADDVGGAVRQCEVSVRRAVDEFFVIYVAGGQRAQFDRLRRLVALQEFLGDVQGLDISELEIGAFDHLRVFEAGCFTVKNNCCHCVTPMVFDG
ncbi:hypothetical protein D3C76_1486200 [compost metagenome]